MAAWRFSVTTTVATAPVSASVAPSPAPATAAASALTGALATAFLAATPQSQVASARVTVRSPRPQIPARSPWLPRRRRP